MSTESKDKIGDTKSCVFFMSLHYHNDTTVKRRLFACVGAFFKAYLEVFLI